VGSDIAWTLGTIQAVRFLMSGHSCISPTSIRGGRTVEAALRVSYRRQFAPVNLRNWGVIVTARNDTTHEPPVLRLVRLLSGSSRAVPTRVAADV